MGILTTHQLQAVDRVGVGTGGQKGPLDWGTLATTDVPDDYLPTVGPSNDVVRMELAECDGHHRTL